MIVSITAGIFLMIVGAVIWKFTLVSLFIGRRAAKDVDRPGLAKWIGANLIIIGIVVSIFAVIQTMIFQRTYLAADFIIILILSTRMAFGTSRFYHVKGSKKNPNRKK